MKRVAAALLALCPAARGEEIRIQVARGLASARIEEGGRAQVVRPAQAPLRFEGPVRLDGQSLPGALELFSDRDRLVAYARHQTWSRVAHKVHAEFGRIRMGRKNSLPAEDAERAEINSHLEI